MFGYTMWNESFEFLLGKCQRAKSHGTKGVGVGVGACYFFFVFFPCLFLCFSSPYWCWIEEGSHIKLIKVHYFLVNSLIFSPSLPLLYLISSPYSLSGATERIWIIELIKVNYWSKPTGPFGYSWKLKPETENWKIL